ncbi:hypothetical protein DBO95_21800 [Yersinia pestis]|nr:hypothetical protein DBO95_21800 [Yersinia pestis]
MIWNIWQGRRGGTDLGFAVVHCGESGLDRSGQEKDIMKFDDSLDDSG